MHIFTFTDTDYLPTPVTDMPILTDILRNKGGGVEDHLKFVCTLPLIILWAAEFTMSASFVTNRS